MIIFFLHQESVYTYSISLCSWKYGYVEGPKIFHFMLFIFPHQLHTHVFPSTSSSYFLCDFVVYYAWHWALRAIWFTCTWSSRNYMKWRRKRKLSTVREDIQCYERRDIDTPPWHPRSEIDYQISKLLWWIQLNFIFHFVFANSSNYRQTR